MPLPPATVEPIAVAHGYGVRISVERGHLVVEDGICEERRSRRYSRATSRLQRLVVIGHTGFVTLEALRWIRDVGPANALATDREQATEERSLARARDPQLPLRNPRI